MKFIRKEEQVVFKDKWEYLELFMDFRFYKSKQITTKMKIIIFHWTIWLDKIISTKT